MNPVHDWAKIETKETLPGFRGKFLHSDNMTFVLWEIDSGAELPAHSHPHEQTAHILEGSFELTIDDETKVAHAGNVAFIPSNAVHSGKALSSCRIMDVFYPRREDYMPGATSGLFSAS
jgi:quercetin dioxygenase-like cupin family protein